MSQFLETFFEESFEGLDIMENGLLNLDIGAADVEVVNTIFRAAHSIKGGSATFGLSDVADFTHLMETLLDEMRDGRRDVSEHAVDNLLKSVDVLRDLLMASKDKTDIDTVRIEEIKANLNKILGNESTAEESSAADAPQAAEESANSTDLADSAGWSIKFVPGKEIFQTGNDPLRMLRELDGMGEYEVVLNHEALPDFDMMDPEECHVYWAITLHANVTEEKIREVFEWVEDESDITVERLTSTADNSDDSGLQVDVLAKSFSELNKHGKKFTARFYERLFEKHPGVKPLFESSSPDLQAEKLWVALTLVANNLKNPDKLVAAVAELGKRHEAYGAKPEHYTAVAETMLEVMPEFCEGVWDASCHQAWSHALNLVASVMIEAAANNKPSPEIAATPAASTSSPVKDKSTKKAVESSSIRVGIDKVDELIDMVGELVITQSMLSQLGDDFDMSRLEKLTDGLAELEQNTRELQESVMRIRMLPINFAFQRFPRMVRDLSQKLNKKIELIMSGESTELDKTVMEKIGDPLVHLVRNSLDHGLETPEVRLAAGKSEVGTVHLNAYHQGGNIVIDIKDDGAGINKKKITEKAIERGLITEEEAKSITEEKVFDLLFQPGFSTAEVVSDVSGRGVGMDVVKRNIRALGGSVNVVSEEGVGSTFTIRLPLTLAILDGQLVRVGDQTYIIPLVSIVESLQVKEGTVSKVAGKAELYRLREEYIPLARLYEIFNIDSEFTDLHDGLVVVVEADGQQVGIFVDDLLSQQQVVIKSLEVNYQKVMGVSGATILGDGTVALILDMTGLVEITKEQNTPTGSAGDSRAA